MKRLTIPRDATSTLTNGVQHMRLLLLQRGYDATLQEAWNMQVWLARQREVDEWLLLAPPITEEELDDAIAAGVLTIDD